MGLTPARSVGASIAEVVGSAMRLPAARTLGVSTSTSGRAVVRPEASPPSPGSAKPPSGLLFPRELHAKAALKPVVP